MSVTLSTFYADGFMMSQKGYFVMSLVDRGQPIIIFLLQLLLARVFCQVSLLPVFASLTPHPLLVLVVWARESLLQHWLPLTFVEEVSDGVQYLALGPICIILPCHSSQLSCDPLPPSPWIGADAVKTQKVVVSGVDWLSILDSNVILLRFCW
ncbi:hypothetical protein MTR67_052960 [Solanum verrucosum]|uniref:Uncharacterized protein n=1 Tax=Solanum verrucosum TaxID=315347 RepID=A0AAF0V6Q3_SOLVR|nr:hypothetical protein MTR67_052960 [Solanum verrucosum]